MCPKAGTKHSAISTGCPNKHGNSVTIRYRLCYELALQYLISKAIILLSARFYLMKTVNCCKDASIMSPQDEQLRRTGLLCLYTAIFLF